MTKPTEQATPRPWTAEGSLLEIDGEACPQIRPVGDPVALAVVIGPGGLEQQEADAAFIVEAVNSYDALQSYVSTLEASLSEANDAWAREAKRRKALVKAAEERVYWGHNDTCSKELTPSVYECTCGHDDLAAALRLATSDGTDTKEGA